MKEEEEFKATSLDDALGESGGAGDAPEPETPIVEEPKAEQTPEAKEEAKTAPEPAQDTQPEPEAPKAEETPADDADKPWTYHMAMDEKQKRKDIERERDEVKARLAAFEYQQKQNQPKPQAPDVFSDPDKYGEYVQQQAIAPLMPVLQSLRLQLAETRHTPEAVKAANEWYDTLPPQHQQAISQRYGASQDPYGDLVNEHKRQSVLSQVGDDPSEWEAFQAWKATQGQEQPQPQQTQQPAQNSQSQVKLMPSATKSPSMASRSGPVWAGPKTLEDILPE